MTESSQQSDEPTVDRRSADIGIVCRQAMEVRPLLKALDRVRKYDDEGVTFRGGFLRESIRVAVVECGSGFAGHRRAAQTLIAEHHPTWVLSVGFSSPLIEELKSGDVCLASEIADTHGNLLPVSCTIPEGKRVLVRKHVVADRHPLTSSDRKQLDSVNAAAVDTTSLGVAQACGELINEKPAARFLSIRGIVGNVSDELDQEIAEFLFAAESQAKTTGLKKLWSTLRTDSKLKPWKTAAEQTAANLNKFVLSVVERLGESLER